MKKNYLQASWHLNPPKFLMWLKKWKNGTREQTDTHYIWNYAYDTKGSKVWGTALMDIWMSRELAHAFYER